MICHTCDILKKYQGDFPLAAELNEMCSLEGGFRKKYPIISNYSNRVAKNVRKPLKKA